MKNTSDGRGSDGDCQRFDNSLSNSLSKAVQRGFIEIIKENRGHISLTLNVFRFYLATALIYFLHKITMKAESISQTCIVVWRRLVCW